MTLVVAQDASQRELVVAVAQSRVDAQRRLERERRQARARAEDATSELRMAGGRVRGREAERWVWHEPS